MNYWHMQLHPSNIEWNKERDVLEKFQVIGMGVWDEDASQQELFEKVMDIGDIVVVKRGANIIAMTEVVGDYEYHEVEEGQDDWFERRRKIKVLDWYNKIYNLKISPRGTLVKCNVNGDAESTQSIVKWYKMFMMKKLHEKAIDILNYKKQIILQGPPGTGKTWLARQLAKDLTKLVNKGNPIKLVNDLVNAFDFNDPKNKDERESDQRLLGEFNQLFPKEKLNELNLESYCIGRGGRFNFCWWIERGLKPLGYYFPGSSQTYMIYWKKKISAYSKHGFAKDIQNDEDVINKIAETLKNVVINNNIQEGNSLFSSGFLLKILNSYYPEEYFPIFSERAIENGLKIFGVLDFKGQGIVAKNRLLNEKYKEKMLELKSPMTSFEFQRLLWRNFDMKEGKDVITGNELVGEGAYEIVQFHPAYSYEDFVRGIVAKTVETEDSISYITYKVENKILANLAQKAIDNPNGNYVLVIDEINRANLPSVLGELIYSLEYRDDPVASIYRLEQEDPVDDDEESDSLIVLPKKNLFIIGTMNTADRSVGHIDYALRRRFAFVDVLPDDSLIDNDKAKRIFKEVETLFDGNCLSPDFTKEQVMIGHSYFMVENDDELKMRLDFEIIPILKEYVRDGVLNDKALEKINSLHV